MGNKQAANIEDCVLEAAPEQARTTGVQLAEQLAWHWRNQVRERLAGLSDEEYFWEPAGPSWSLRPRGRSDAPVQGGSGELVIEFAFPEPDPAPFTTIAWRLGHVLVGVLGTRNATHFGHEPTDYFGYDYPVTAAEALARLERELRRWVAGVAVLTDDQLWQPVGESEGGWADHPMIELVLHINREVIHHLSEVALIRDLYAHGPHAALGRGGSSGGGQVEG